MPHLTEPVTRLTIYKPWPAPLWRHSFALFLNNYIHLRKLLKPKSSAAKCFVLPLLQLGQDHTHAGVVAKVAFKEWMEGLFLQLMNRLCPTCRHCVFTGNKHPLRHRRRALLCCTSSLITISSISGTSIRNNYKSVPDIVRKNPNIQMIGIIFYISVT